MSTAKQPIDLCAAVKARVDTIAFFLLLRLKDIPNRACSTLGGGTSESYSQGVRLNESVGIFLDWWGSMSPHKHYSFAVFEQKGRRWSKVHSHLEDLDEAIAIAIHALAEQALLSTKAAS